jgi:response regulator NasT
MIRLRILLVTESCEHAVPIEQALSDARHQVVATIRPDDDLALYAQQAQPDALVAELDTPSAAFLEQLRRLDERQPRTVVVFAAHSDNKTTRAAIKAGASSYVVDGFRPGRVVPVLEAAVARFAELQVLRGQRDEALTKLSERRTIEQAKGILMQRRHLTENAAHVALRKMAMDRGKRIPEMAESIILVEEAFAQG